jgi:2'-5' RNA ligase
MQSGPQLSSLARLVDETTFSLGIPREDHAFSPHLTLARGGGGSGAPRRQKGDRPNRDFQRLQENVGVLPPPEFGTMTAHEFFLYESELGRGGSRYTKLARFALE